jgi:hypothetical protein
VVELAQSVSAVGGFVADSAKIVDSGLFAGVARVGVLPFVRCRVNRVVEFGA